MIRIDDERGEMWCSSSILSFLELGWEREARRAVAVVLLFSFHLKAARILRGLRKGGATGREVGLRHGCGPSAEMRGVHRRVRLRRKCRRRQMRSPPGVPARSGVHL